MFYHGLCICKTAEAVTHRFSVKQVFLKISKNSQKNTCASLRPATLLKKRLWHWCFPVNFAKFLRTPFLTEPLWWLLLLIQVLCKSTLDKTCGALSTYFGRSQINLPIVKHLFSSRCRESNLRVFFTMVFQTFCACSWIYHSAFHLFIYFSLFNFGVKYSST